jgi:hypothetical protein
MHATTQELDFPIAVYRGSESTNADESFVTGDITVKKKMKVGGTNVIKLLKEMERELSDAKHHIGALKVEIDNLAKYRPGSGPEFKKAFARFASKTSPSSISFRFIILFAVILCEAVCILFCK